MSRWQCGGVPLTVLLATLMMPSARAQDQAIPGRFHGAAQPIASQQFAPAPIGAPVVAGGVVAPVPAPGVQPGYVHLGAPLYPSPRPNIPVWTGSTFITNQALAPHEMLYPHTYRALYPPYYHRVKGGYMWTPFGMRTHEKWELQGTMVQVKYRSHQPFFHKLHAPTISTNGGPWY